jgi:hypothetical protein
MDEARVRQFLIIWLNNNNYDIKHLPPDWGKGPWRTGRGARHIAPQPPDIYAKRRSDYPYFYYIEAKGDPPSTTKLQTAMGQIRACMGSTAPASYGMAFPMDFCRIIRDHLSYEAWDGLGANILLVDDNGEVFELNRSKNNYEWIVANSNR